MRIAWKTQKSAALAALALAFVFILANQAVDQGFQSGHRGFCSANVMAIIENATAENGFVGYTLDFLQKDGRHFYYYFDRYPVFFSAGMHVVLNTFSLSRGAQLQLARQIMNVMHGVTLLASLVLLIELEVPVGIAVAAVALAASGTLIVTYRDMIHFDHPALAGFMALLAAIARWYRTKNDRLVYLVAVLAVLSGRGYASFAVLGVWWIVETVRAVRTDARAAFKQVALGVQTRACLLAIAVGASCLTYNVWCEARKLDVPMSEVGIVSSAIRRLAFDAHSEQRQLRAVSWGAFFSRQAERAVRNLQPYAFQARISKSVVAREVGAALLALVVALFIRSRRTELRAPLIVVALAGLAWIVAMRGLTTFHEFTIMFLFGLDLLFFAALLSWVPRRFELVAAVLGCACLVASTYQRNHELVAIGRNDAIYTQDLARIEAKLAPGEPIGAGRVHRKLVPGVPYALGWFLPSHAIARESVARVHLTSKKPGHDNLTPHNDRIFLVSGSVPERPRPHKPKHKRHKK